MSRKRTPRKPRKLNPLYIIFCEGETESEYISFIRSAYRAPIEIKTKVSGQSITGAFIKNHLREIKRSLLTKHDKVFLMYDFDSAEINKRLLSISGVIILASNPCIELWFLLHYRDQNAELSGQACINHLKKFNPEYKKGTLSGSLKKDLTNNQAAAIMRAKSLAEHENPSSTVYKLLDEVLSIKSITNSQ